MAIVDQTGLATALHTGEATMTASAGGTTGSARLTVIAGLVQLDVSGLHTCAVAPDAQAYCWGINSTGELGDGTFTSRSIPTAVAGAVAFRAVSAGKHHTCGVTTSDQAYCWGFNDSGQLGDGTRSTSAVPLAVAGSLSFASVSAGRFHSCGVTTGGQAYCWGGSGRLSSLPNNQGELGDGTRTDKLTPVPVAGGLSFTEVTAGQLHTCGVTQGGEAYCWGTNDYSGVGVLGTGTTGGFSTVPVAVAGGLRFATVSAGQQHTCGVTLSGEAYCWGDNGTRGQLGDGTTIDRGVPTAVLGGLTFSAVSAGEAHTCGVTTSGQAYCWGSRLLGDGTDTGSSVPVAVVGDLHFATVGAGGAHTCGLTTDGLGYCWGSGGLLGNGSTEPDFSLVPVRVAFP
ncbi:MAG: chromosome condensation regulator RCC1 [Gemmatimonadetes bacterium]|nr:chromosome condensation regulator RCC1 [Gemmatimonadota bacterium]